MPFSIVLTFKECLTAAGIIVGITACLCPLQRWLLVLVVAILATAIWKRLNNTRKSTHSIRPQWAGVIIKENSIFTQAAIEPLSDFDWTAIKPIQLRPFKPKFFLTMGLETASASTLINIDRDFFDRLALRREILKSQHQQCVRATEAVQPAVNELYHFLVQTYLPIRFPTIFTIDPAADCLFNQVSGESYPLSCPPTAATTLTTLGTMVDEDFMILLPDADGDSYSLQGYIACFSSGFDVDKMLGRKLRDLHVEVPRYQEKLQLSMERWLERLRPGKYVSRTNWTITTHGRLRNSYGENQVYETHADGIRREGTEIDVSEAHLRAELQQIHRLPQSRAIVFCYKTYLYPLRDIKEEGNGEALARAIEGLTQGNVPEIARYKGSTVWGRQVIEFLRK